MFLIPKSKTIYKERDRVRMEGKGQSLQYTVVGKLGSQMQKNGTGLLFTPYVTTTSKWIKT